MKVIRKAMKKLFKDNKVDILEPRAQWRICVWSENLMQPNRSVLQRMDSEVWLKPIHTSFVLFGAKCASQYWPEGSKFLYSRFPVKLVLLLLLCINLYLDINILLKKHLIEALFCS